MGWLYRTRALRPNFSQIACNSYGTVSRPRTAPDLEDAAVLLWQFTRTAIIGRLTGIAVASTIGTGGITSKIRAVLRGEAPATRAEGETNETTERTEQTQFRLC